MSIVLKNRLKNHFTTKVIFFIVSIVFSYQMLLASQDDLLVELVPSQELYKPADPVILALKIKIPQKYHLYGNPLGPGIGKPLQISVDGGGRIDWQGIRAPAANRYKPPVGDWVFAYENEAVFFIQGRIPPDFSGAAGGSVQIDGLICNTACIPVKHKIPFSVHINESAGAGLHFSKDPDLAGKMAAATDTMPLSMGSTNPEAAVTGIDLSGFSITPPLQNTLIQWSYSPLESGVTFNIFLAVLFGFLAGIIMNVMPCVLPVLGIKILSFSDARKSSRRKAVLKSLVFSSGMLSIFMVLASLASFANFSWGEQFQNPAVLVVIIAVIVIFALGMFDLFIIQVPGSIASMSGKKRDGLAGDFLNGMFATILATPCSGPLLGATLAWTLTQKTTVIFAVFISVGMGMAFPYILLSISSTISGMIPKPGKWMNDFKHLMGFVLLGFAVYLMAGLPQNMLVVTIGMCLVLVYSMFFYARYAPFGSTLNKKITIAAIALVIALSGVYVNFGLLYKPVLPETTGGALQEDGGWKEFSADILRSAHEKGQSVMVDFTANWCVNCQFNKVAVLHTPKISKLIREKNIIALKADLTRPNEQIESLLHHLGSRSVPFLAIFSGENPYKPVIMRDIIDKKKLVRILEGLGEE